MVNKIKEALIERTKGIPYSRIPSYLDRLNLAFGVMLRLELLTVEEYKEVIRFMYDIDWKKQSTYYDDCF